jgi:hypothetical protein
MRTIAFPTWDFSPGNVFDLVQVQVPCSRETLYEVPA